MFADHNQLSFNLFTTLLLHFYYICARYSFYYKLMTMSLWAMVYGIVNAAHLGMPRRAQFRGT